MLTSKVENSEASISESIFFVLVLSDMFFYGRADLSLFVMMIIHLERNVLIGRREREREGESLFFPVFIVLNVPLADVYT